MNTDNCSQKFTEKKQDPQQQNLWNNIKKYSKI